MPPGTITCTLCQNPAIMPAITMEISSTMSVRSEPTPTNVRARSGSPSGVMAVAGSLLATGYKFLQGSRSGSHAILDQQPNVSTPIAAGPPQQRYPAACHEQGQTPPLSTPPGMAALALRGRDSTGSSTALARRRTRQRFTIGEENPYALDAYNPDIPLHVRVANLQKIMEMVLEQAKSADSAKRSTADDVQEAIIGEKDLFDDFMTEFASIPEVQQKQYSRNRSYQDMLDSYMSHFGAHVEGVTGMLDD